MGAESISCGSLRTSLATSPICSSARTTRIYSISLFFALAAFFVFLVIGRFCPIGR